MITKVVFVLTSVVLFGVVLLRLFAPPLYRRYVSRVFTESRSGSLAGPIAALLILVFFVGPLIFRGTTDHPLVTNTTRETGVLEQVEFFLGVLFSMGTGLPLLIFPEPIVAKLISQDAVDLASNPQFARALRIVGRSIGAIFFFAGSMMILNFR